MKIKNDKIKKIIIASKNQGKIKDLIHAFDDLHILINSVIEFYNIFDAV